MKHIGPAMLMLLVLLSPLGCASNHSAQNSSQRTGLLIEPLDADALNYSINWAADLDLPKDQQLSSATVLGDLLVTIEYPEGTTTGISMRDGSIKWRRILGNPAQPLFEPVRRGDDLFVISSTTMYTLDAGNGKLKNVAELNEIASSSPVLMENFAIYGSINGRVVAHDVNTGFAKWSYQLTDRITAAPLTVGSNVFVADASGVYAMLQATNGSLLWRGKTFGPVTAAPDADRLSVFVASEDQALYAINRATGRDRWPAFHAEHRLTAAPRSFGLNVFLPLPGTALLAIDSVAGTERWRLDYSALPVTLSDDTLVIATHNSLQLVNVETGKVLHKSPTKPIVTVLQGENDSLVLVSPQGKLLRLNARK